MLGWQEIKQRYRRSKLGPFWLTISTGVMIGAMGPLYGRLFGQDVGSYVAYLAVSLVSWNFISNLINEACSTFIAAESYIKQIKLPLTLHVLRAVWRNVIVFLHNLPILLVALVLYPPSSYAYLALAPIGVLLIAINGIWVGLFLGAVCARFRDIPPIIGSIVLVLFFLTPVLWNVGMLGNNRWAAEINPLFHFLEVMREPLLGRPPTLLNWVGVIVVTALGWIITLALFSRFRSRIAYWV